MRYLGQLGVAVAAASRADASAPAPVGRPDGGLPGQPGLPAERAAAWRAWAAAGAETAPPTAGEPPVVARALSRAARPEG